MFDYSSLVMAMRQKPYLYRGMNKRWALLEMLLYINQTLYRNGGGAYDSLEFEIM
jgi:hypothetical protein